MRTDLDHMKADKLKQYYERELLCFSTISTAGATLYERKGINRATLHTSLKVFQGILAECHVKRTPDTCRESF